MLNFKKSPKPNKKHTISGQQIGNVPTNPVDILNEKPISVKREAPLPPVQIVEPANDKDTNKIQLATPVITTNVKRNRSFSESMTNGNKIDIKIEGQPRGKVSPINLISSSDESNKSGNVLQIIGSSGSVDSMSKLPGGNGKKYQAPKPPIKIHTSQKPKVAPKPTSRPDSRCSEKSINSGSLNGRSQSRPTSQSDNTNNFMNTNSTSKCYFSPIPDSHINSPIDSRVSSSSNIEAQAKEIEEQANANFQILTQSETQLSAREKDKPNCAIEPNSKKRRSSLEDKSSINVNNSLENLNVSSYAMNKKYLKKVESRNSINTGGNSKYNAGSGCRNSIRKRSFQRKRRNSREGTQEISLSGTVPSGLPGNLNSTPTNSETQIVNFEPNSSRISNTEEDSFTEGNKKSYEYTDLIEQPVFETDLDDLNVSHDVGVSEGSESTLQSKQNSVKVKLADISRPNKMVFNLSPKGKCLSTSHIVTGHWFWGFRHSIFCVLNFRQALTLKSYSSWLSLNPSPHATPIQKAPNNLTRSDRNYTKNLIQNSQSPTQKTTHQSSIAISNQNSEETFSTLKKSLNDHKSSSSDISNYILQNSSTRPYTIVKGTGSILRRSLAYANNYQPNDGNASVRKQRPRMMSASTTQSSSSGRTIPSARISSPRSPRDTENRDPYNRAKSISPNRFSDLLNQSLPLNDKERNYYSNAINAVSSGGYSQRSQTLRKNNTTGEISSHGLPKLDFSGLNHQRDSNINALSSNSGRQSSHSTACPSSTSFISGGGSSTSGPNSGVPHTHTQKSSLESQLKYLMYNPADTQSDFKKQKDETDRMLNNLQKSSRSNQNFKSDPKFLEQKRRAREAKNLLKDSNLNVSLNGGSVINKNFKASESKSEALSGGSGEGESAFERLMGSKSGTPR